MASMASPARPTTLETGNTARRSRFSRPARPGARGFTLIELLLVLALLALIAGAIAVNVRTLIPGIGGESLEEKFEIAVRTTRRAALDSGRAQRLVFDPHERTFKARPVGDDPEETGPVPFRPPSTNPDTVRFLRQTTQGNTYLVGGQLRSLEPSVAVLFYPDGTCSPFTAEIREGTSVREIRIDPWTTAEIVGEVKK
jgi:prepilin-type N-terminal cleavage/methylation domain-containing protein